MFDDSNFPVSGLESPVLLKLISFTKVIALNSHTRNHQELDKLLPLMKLWKTLCCLQNPQVLKKTLETVQTFFSKASSVAKIEAKFELFSKSELLGVVLGQLSNTNKAIQHVASQIVSHTSKLISADSEDTVELCQGSPPDGSDEHLPHYFVTLDAFSAALPFIFERIASGDAPLCLFHQVWEYVKNSCVQFDQRWLGYIDTLLS